MPKANFTRSSQFCWCTNPDVCQASTKSAFPLWATETTRLEPLALTLAEH
jgi:hypothetical protein